MLLGLNQGVGLVAQQAAKREKEQASDEAKQCEEQPKREFVADIVLEPVRQLPVGRESIASSPRVGDLLSEAADQVIQLFGSLDKIFSLEPKKQDGVEDFQHLDVGHRVDTHRLQFVEEILAGEMFAEQAELQRISLPEWTNRKT